MPPATRKGRFRVKPASIAALREELLGSDRRGGVVGKFKWALGHAVHHARDTYSKFHFTKAAYPRYGVLPAKYTKESALSKAGATVTFNGTTLTPPYSVKSIRQAKAGFPVTDDPLVFSGDTRRAILNGPFSLGRGSSKRVRGHWSGYRIAWAGLHKNNLGGRGLTYINNQELQFLKNRIRSKFNMLVDQKRTVPRTFDGTERNL